MKELLAITNEVSVSGINKMVSELETQVMEGVINPLELAVTIKIFPVLAKKLRSSRIITDAILEECSLYAEAATLLGCKIEAGSKVTYDYSKSEAYNRINYLQDNIKEELESLKAKLEEVKKLAKATKLEAIWVDEETGEALKVVPAVREEVDLYKVSLKKD